MMFSINPATGEEIARFPLHGAAEIEAALAGAAAAQAEWRQVSVERRIELLRSMAKILRARKAALAHLITLEVGKPITQSEAEVEKCALNCDFYAERAPGWLADVAVDAAAQQSAVVFDPLGVILAVMPWNYPLWQVFRFLAPALAAGNGAILKHAANVPQCAMAIEQVVIDAGCPTGLFRALLVEPDAVAAMIADDRIAAITLTGSTQVGKIVAAQAGKALKKQVLELGGSDPFIVLEDADLEKAAAAAVKGRFINAGQSCVNAKRFIIVESVAERFTDLFVAKAAALRLGDPLNPAIEIGPLARANLRDQLHRQVTQTLAAGATLRLGGEPAAGPGFFYPPTILDHVTPDMAAFCEETFGPVAAIIRAKDQDEAIRLANQTEFGLGASIWTRNTEQAKRLARRIDAGAVFVNAIVASDPRLPFGGIKQSGYGRELADVGMREFVNIKTLCVDPA
jgi:succinate-semialdehyde dehydrogenase/glutarate-semialdehyde dehydrogenase